MGYYLQTKEDLHKADQLLPEHPEVQEVDQSSLRFDKTRNTVLVCVFQTRALNRPHPRTPTLPSHKLTAPRDGRGESVNRSDRRGRSPQS